MCESWQLQHLTVINPLSFSPGQNQDAKLAVSATGDGISVIPSGQLLAWIEEIGCGGFLAAFVGEGAPERSPALHKCSSPEAAREWIITQADALSLPVKWLSQTRCLRSPKEGC
jgi:hypothetical protein